MRAIRAARASVLGVALSMSLLGFGLVSAAPALAGGTMQNSSAPPPVTEQTIDNRPFHVSKLVIKCRPERVWQILTDYCNATYVFPHLKKCSVVEDKGTTKIMDHVVKPTGLPGTTFAYRLSVKENHHQMTLEWHRVSGAFRDVDGYWKVEPLDGGHSTLVTYAAHINGGMFLPPPLIRRQMRQDMPEVMMSLKREAESASATHIAKQNDASKRNN